MKTLSDFIIGIEDREGLFIDDVKQFIKDLKLEIEEYDLDTRIIQWIEDDIDKLAGDKLI